MDATQIHRSAYAIKMNRIEYGLTVEQLAEMSGLSVADIEAIEAERYPLTGVEINAIAEAMGIANWVLMV